MASLSLKHIYKVYDGGVKAVNDFNMQIKDKEFIVFVGPSGCGKSTTLRMIAGLEEISAGELMIGDEVVNDVEPKDRNIAMVFQNYALYPHMTVRENMEFALKLKKMPQEEIDAKVNEAAKILDIEQYLERKPRALSGGQRQRVSLGRAIVRSPKVFLLDEPLSNLDAKLRAQMRTEISKLHERLATTFIYVTHDQVEAMTMGTRIVVMKTGGFVQQIDTPQNLYNYPANIFVAGFIGTPQMNFFEATMKKEGDVVKIKFANDRVIDVPYTNLLKTKTKYFDGETPVVLGIRPEDVHIDKAFVDAHPETSLKTEIGLVEALGSESIIYCELDAENNNDITNTKTRLVVKVDPRTPVSKGDAVTLAIDPERIHLFDKVTESTIIPRIPADTDLEGDVKDGVLSIADYTIKLPDAIKLANGKYKLSVPTDAVLVDGENYGDEEDYPVMTIPTVEGKFAASSPSIVEPIAFAAKKGVPMGDSYNAEIIKQEKVIDDNLLQLKLGKYVIFALTKEPLAATSVKICIDLKKVTFEGADNVSALNLVNVLKGKFDKQKASSKSFNYLLNINGVNFRSTDSISKKLITASGRKVFNVNLAFDFSPYDVVFADQGIAAKVEEILDYGVEKFAKCSVVTIDGSAEVIVSMPEAVEVGASVCLHVNPYTVGIVDADRDIRVV